MKIDPHNERNIGLRTVSRVSLGWRTGIPEMADTQRVSCTSFSPLFEGSDRLSLAASQSQANFKKEILLTSAPFQRWPLRAEGTISEIQVDKILVRYSQFLGQIFEIVNRRNFETDCNLLLQLSHIWVRLCF